MLRDADTARCEMPARSRPRDMPPMPLKRSRTFICPRLLAEGARRDGKLSHPADTRRDSGRQVENGCRLLRSRSCDLLPQGRPGGKSSRASPAVVAGSARSRWLIRDERRNSLTRRASAPRSSDSVLRKDSDTGTPAPGILGPSHVAERNAHPAILRSVPPRRQARIRRKTESRPLGSEPPWRRGPSRLGLPRETRWRRSGH